MKKVSLFLLMWLGMTLSMVAQTTVVKGLVVDSLSREPEPYTTIRVYQGDLTTTPVAQFISSLEGVISQEIKGRGDFLMLLTSVGRADKVVPFTLSGEAEKDLGTILLSDDVQALAGIEVVAQKPLVKMEVDRMSYKVEDDVDAKSSTVLEMLRKVPMVTVDGNDNITVNGSSSFKVYVDGKPNQMMSSYPSMVFKNIPASAVQDIEVITNPGVRFDAEGVGGVLNIVMSKGADGGATAQNLNGYNGDVRVMAGTQNYGGSATVSVQQGKLSLSANASLIKGKMDDVETDVEREQFTEVGTSVISNEQEGDSRYTFVIGNLSVGYEIDSLRLVSGTFGITSYNLSNGFTGLTGISGLGNGISYKSLMEQTMRNQSINASLDYQRAFASKKDRLLTLSYQLSSAPAKDDSWNRYDHDEASGQFLNFSDRHSDGKSNSLENTFQADFTEPLGQNQTLNVGMKYINRLNKSDSKYFTLDGNQETLIDGNSMDYRHMNNILAGYAEYSLTAGRMGLKGGLRYEHTWQDVKYKKGNGEDFSLDYGNLVPAADVSYRFSDFSNIGMTYNLRISRPGIGYLNPYVNRTDPTSVSYGNTDLDVEKSHNVGLVYNYFSMKLMMNLTLRQSICNNAIEAYDFYQDGLLHSTYGNIAKNRQSSANLFVNWSPLSKTRFILNGSLSYVDLRSSQLDLKNHGWQGNLMVGVMQTLPGDIRLSLNAVTATKSYSLQGWSSGFNMLTGSLSKTLMNDRLSISLSGVTGLSSKGMKMESYTSGKNFNNRMVSRIPLRFVSLSISYSFGGNKSASAKKAKKSIVNDDVMNTQSQAESMGGMIGM